MAWERGKVKFVGGAAVAGGEWRVRAVSHPTGTAAPVGAAGLRSGQSSQDPSLGVFCILSGFVYVSTSYRRGAFREAFELIFVYLRMARQPYRD